jgi:hypothetical protein
MAHARLRSILQAAPLAMLVALGAQAQPPAPGGPQPGTQPAPQASEQPGEKMLPPKRITQRFAPQFKSIMRIDSTGKLVHIDESLDIKAIGNNHLISMEDRARLSPAIRAWLDDIDQLTIDDLDYLEQIEPLDGSPGILSKMDTDDPLQQKMVGSMMTHLMSAGQLTTAMQTKGLLNAAQAGMNQAIINEYLQAMMNEVVQANGGGRGNLSPEEQKKQTKAVTSFLYYMTSRDAIEAYRRLVSDAAVVADRAIDLMHLPSEESARLAPLAANAKSASAGADRRKAMDALLKAMSFDQRRAFLAKARELGPIQTDPLAGLPPPPPPPPQAPPTPAPEAPAAAPDASAPGK